ncbi:glycosyltransferase family 2 protein [Sphingomonas citri]
MTRLAVSFVLYRTPAAEIDRAIEQVRASVPDARVILVDNSPEPIAVTAIDGDAVRLLRPGANLGYGSGHNRAFALTADARYHAVLNTDLTFGPEVLPALMRFMDANADVGLTMPRVCYPDGSIQHLCRLLPHPLDIFGRGFLGSSRWTARRNERYEFRSWTYDRAAQFPFLSGCFMLLRREALDAIGGFDERFFMYGEDVDLSRRMNAAWRTMFVPTDPVAHDYRSAGVGLRRHPIKIRNMIRYFNKWGWFHDRDRTRRNAATIAALTGENTG